MTDDMKIPQLTLTTALEGELGVQETVTVKSPVKLEESTLTPEEQAIVDDFAKKIDIKNTNVILLYGSAAQKNVADFSDTALNNVRTKDMGEAGEMLSNLVAELKGFNDETDVKKGIFGIARSYRRHVEILKNNYGKLEASIDSICHSLEQQQTILLKDVAMLDKMYDMNKVYFKELTMYILAGEKKLKEVRDNDLVQLIEKGPLHRQPDGCSSCQRPVQHVRPF
ncbi:MAG: toxic anion resistance protein [Eubacteriales bacterium]